MRYWVPYVKARGSLNLGMRIEQGFALLAHIINHALGGHATVSDYMPHADTPQVADAPEDIQAVIRLLTGVALGTQAAGLKPKKRA